MPFARDVTADKEQIGAIATSLGEAFVLICDIHAAGTLAELGARSSDSSRVERRFGLDGWSARHSFKPAPDLAHRWGHETAHLKIAGQRRHATCSCSSLTAIATTTGTNQEPR
jgi:hypothetical protein